MATIKFTALVATLLVTLSACGGGGESEPTACTPRAVRVQLFGDSTQAGFDGKTQMMANPTPAQVLQVEMDSRFGLGAVVVENRGVVGTDTRHILAGTDGKNLPWPQSATADVLVVNYGINDAARISLEQYRGNLRAIGAVRVIFETPNPQVSDAPPLADAAVGPFAQAMREVAAEKGYALADVNQYVLGLPGWDSYYLGPADQTHPSTELYRLIVVNVLASVVGQQVAPLVKVFSCQ